MGGHIHSGLRMAMSGDRNSFTMSSSVISAISVTESPIHLIHLSSVESL